MVLKKNFLSLKTCKKNIPAWPNPPPPLEVKWSLPYKREDRNIHIYNVLSR